jgi:hypothetical protein
MSINAYSPGEVISAVSMNQLIRLQPFQLIYEGLPMRSSLPTVGAYLRTDSHATVLPFTLVGDRLDRVNLDIYKTGTISPPDLRVQIRRGMTTSAPGTDGSLVAERLIPWEWIPSTRNPAWWLSVPFGIREGLTDGEQLFLCIDRAGSSNTYFNLAAATTQNASFQTFRRSAMLGSSGVTPITADNQVRYQIMAGDGGDLRNSIFSNALTQLDYGTDGVSRVLRYLPPSATAEGGIRDILTLKYVNGMIIGGEVTP